MSTDDASDVDVFDVACDALNAALTRAEEHMRARYRVRAGLREPDGLLVWSKIGGRWGILWHHGDSDDGIPIHDAPLHIRLIAAQRLQALLLECDVVSTTRLREVNDAVATIERVLTGHGRLDVQTLSASVGDPVKEEIEWLRELSIPGWMAVYTDEQGQQCPEECAVRWEQWFVDSDRCLYVTREAKYEQTVGGPLRVAGPWTDGPFDSESEKRITSFVALQELCKRMLADPSPVRPDPVDVDLLHPSLRGRRRIVGHDDGHGLAESIVIEADGPGPGGASHHYVVYSEDGMVVAIIQYQSGPRNETGSTLGVIDSVLLAIVADRMEKFNEGAYRCRENSLVLTKVEEALHWLKHRADERARRGVLGKNLK